MNGFDEAKALSCMKSRDAVTFGRKRGAMAPQKGDEHHGDAQEDEHEEDDEGGEGGGGGCEASVDCRGERVADRGTRRACTGRLLGDSVKQSAQTKVLERKWLRFLIVHGKKYGF